MSRLYLSNPCALLQFLHTVLRAQSAPGFPCALYSKRANEIAKPGRKRAAGTRGLARKRPPPAIARLKRA